MESFDEVIETAEEFLEYLKGVDLQDVEIIAAGTNPLKKVPIHNVKTSPKKQV